MSGSLIKFNIEAIPNHEKNVYRTLSKEDKKSFIELMKKHPNDYDKISSYFPGMKSQKCKQFYLKFKQEELYNRPWTEDEEAQLMTLTEKHDKKWNIIGKNLQRTNNQCRRKYFLLIKKEKNLPDPRSSSVFPEKIFDLSNPNLPNSNFDCFLALPEEIPDLPGSNSSNSNSDNSDHKFESSGDENNKDKIYF